MLNISETVRDTNTHIVTMKYQHLPYSSVSFQTTSRTLTLSELVKYSMTRSIARSLCNSWASCSDCQHSTCEIVAWSVCHRRLYWGL